MRASLTPPTAKLVKGVLLSTVLLVSPMAFAQEGGEITLVFDGETFTFPLSAGHSDWSGSARYGSVNILARPTDDATWKRFKTLALWFELVNGKAADPKASLLRVAGDGSLSRIFSRQDQGGLIVDVKAHSYEEDILRIDGSFTGTFGQSEDFGREIDLSDPVALSGDFALSVAPVR